MLVAGAGAADPSAFGGVFPFAVNSSPLNAYWTAGSASNVTMDKQIQPLINLENTSVRSYAPIF